MHFARNGMLKHPIPYIGMGAQANLMVGSGEKRLSFRSSENASQTVVTLWLVRYNHSILAAWPIRRPVRAGRKKM